MAMIDTDEYYTCAEAAEEIARVTGEEIAVASVQKYVKNYGTNRTPQIQGIQIRREWLIHCDELQRFCDSRRQPGRPAAN